MKTRTSARNRKVGGKRGAAAKGRPEAARESRSGGRGAAQDRKLASSGRSSSPARPGARPGGRSAGEPPARAARPTSGRAVAPEPPSAPTQQQVARVRVEADREGQRLDNFLVTRLKGVPRSLIYRICRSGEVRVNGGRAKPDQRLLGGDEVRIPPLRLPSRDEAGAPPAALLERIEAAIIHEDRDFLVIDKPAGIASHGGSGVSFGAIELLRASRPRESLELVHRLDRDTSGVLVLARRRSALTGLQAAIREGRVKKRYLALIPGFLPRSPLVVDAPLRKSVLQGGERMVRVDEEGKPSRSRFIELERFAEASLVEVALDTGRTHQIRVHAQHIGHPLAGDDKYGEREFNKAMRERGLRRLFLHAARFEFSLGESRHVFNAPLAPELSTIIDGLHDTVRTQGRPQ